LPSAQGMHALDPPLCGAAVMSHNKVSTRCDEIAAQGYPERRFASTPSYGTSTRPSTSWAAAHGTQLLHALQGAQLSAAIHCKAVEQAIPASALQIVLATAAIWPARRMRAVPRLRGLIIPQSLSVDMTQHG
jgi:hypothetical protein